MESLNASNPLNHSGICFMYMTGRQMLYEEVLLPYNKYKELCADCLDSELFVRWIGNDAVRRNKTPVELLVLGALRYLGHGWTFDNVEEATAVSKEVHRTFFSQFIEFGRTTLYEKYVIFPTTVKEAKLHMKEFIIAGLMDALGSTDTIHSTMWNCEHNLSNNLLVAT
ncbi:hypothetical protein ACHAWX_000588 [Stephanocyclus meneghinianus]